MGFDFSGYVLRDARVAPSNAESTSPAETGVGRDYKPVPHPYILAPNAPPVVDAAADQYRTAILDNPDIPTTEYLIFAANTSQLALLESFTWAETISDAGSIPTGDLTVTSATPPPTSYEDGTPRLVVSDPGGRSLAEILGLKIKRGDNGVVVDAPFFDSQDADAGLVVLHSSTLTALGGGASAERGDTITEATYIVASARFWWTRNDPYQTRFGWDAKTQKWQPYKGSGPANVGKLLKGETYKVSPTPGGLEVGDYLPGSPAPGGSDAFAMMRLGSRPDASSFPVAKDTVPAPNGVLVVRDEDAESEFNFGAISPPPAAVLGRSSGILQWNQAFIVDHVGKDIWYNFIDFEAESDGTVGPLLGSDTDPLFIAPLPGPTDRPLLRIGFRKWLAPLVVFTDAELPALVVPSGSVGLSLATGKLKINQADIDKSDPESPSFDKHFLGAQVYYDGVSLTWRSQPIREPVLLVDATGSATVVTATGELYIPDGQYLPFIIGLLRFPLGRCGIVHAPDGTGAIPRTGIPGTRPGGDDLGDTTTGLVRQIHDVGDTILFSKKGSIETIEVVSQEADLPGFSFDIDPGVAHIAKERTALGPGSKVALSSTDRALYDGEELYFAQAAFTPSVFTAKARIFSRSVEPFVFNGTEKLYFSIDGSDDTWDASALPPATDNEYTAEQIAASIQPTIGSGGFAYAYRGRVVLSSEDPDNGDVEIGWGKLQVKDNSAATILGFLPGWRADTTHLDYKDNWLPDSGMSFGLYRSQVNLDRQGETPDFQAVSRLEDKILVESVSEQQMVFLDYPPRQDVAGYDEGVFFQLTAVIRDGSRLRLVNKYLEHFEDILHQFSQGKISWIDAHREFQRVQQPIQNIFVGQLQAIPESFLTVLGGQFEVAPTGGAFVPLVYDQDFIFVDGGMSGNALLINRVGIEKGSGSKGAHVTGGTTFTDADAAFVTLGVSKGWRLKLTSGDAQGSYIVDSVIDAQNLEVDPEFLEDGSLISWEIYEGEDANTFDESLIADALYEGFNHLTSEPFEIKLFGLVGQMPTSDAAQTTSRLKAPVSDALASGRQIAWTVELTTGNPIGTMIALLRTGIGTIANNTLFYPQTTPLMIDSRFNTGKFSIQIGGTTITHASGKLVAVPAFTVPIATDTVEYLDTTGEFGFGSGLLADYAGMNVVVVEDFLNPPNLFVTNAEFDPTTGEMNFGAVDIAAFAGKNVYFIEQLKTEQQLDVSVSPLAGSFLMADPVREFTAVQAHYFQADEDGNLAEDDDGNNTEVTEFLPIFVRMEECTRITSRKYSFNPTGRTVDQRVEELIYIGIRLQNYGIDNAVIDYTANTIFFTNEAAATDTVTISYAVFESFGGESAYTASTIPVYRPPFWLYAAQTTFTLKENRTSDMVPGKLLRVGDVPFYIKSSSYSATTQETTVAVFAAPLAETGAKSPGHDSVSLITATSVATEVDGVPIPDAPGGFWATLTAPYEPIPKKAQTFKFQGDVRRFAIAGHVLEIAGYPFLIDSSELTPEGTYTTIKVTAPAPVNFAGTAVRISVRPIYPSGSTDFLLPGAFMPTEPFELVLFGETNGEGDELPGRTLQAGIEYTVDPDAGLISFQEDLQQALDIGQKLYFSHTKVLGLAPFTQDGQVILPRYRADFHFITTPSATNGYLDGTLKATYTFRNPDSFYSQVLPLENYLPDVAKDVLTKGTVSSSGGPLITSISSPNNYEMGNVPLNGERRNLIDLDRAGRTYLDFYNQVIVSLEQILETISGAIVGDRDGRFRFFVGRDKENTPPGFEDPITGVLNPRNLWNEVFLAARTTNPINVIVTDNVVSPIGANLANAEVTGDFMGPDLLGILLEAQKSLIANDVDDLVLTSTQDPTIQFSLPLVFTLLAKGNFARMGDPHIFSRIFPEFSMAFIRTFPGMAADLPTDEGVYAFLKLILDPNFDFLQGGVRLESTFGKTVGKFANPVVGTIKNIVSTTVQDRRPRARIWGYSKTGYPTLAAASGGYPSVIATPLQLKDFPIDPATGLPDLTQLAAQGGALKDLTTGDVDLFLPPFANYEGSTQIGFGEPTGSLYSVGDANNVLSIFTKGRLGGVFFDKVLNGCVVTFKNAGGTAISNPDQIVKLNTDLTSGTPIDLEQGDTIYVTPPGGIETPPNDPPKQEDLERMADNMPSYRVGFDLSVRNKEGELVDVSLPSFADPTFLGIKEILGQKPPAPGTFLEAQVQFTSEVVKPVEIPALTGGDKDDDGDYAIPYLGTRNTELDRLGEIPGQLAIIIETESADTTEYVYPDEVLGDDGTIYGTLTGTLPPATLLTDEDVFPVTHGSLEKGIGDVRRGDLLLVEVNDAATPPIAKGSQGILNIAVAGWDAGNSKSVIEPPRFVTPSNKGDLCRYRFNNVMTHIGGAGATGATVQDTGFSTLINIASVPILVLNDGIPFGTTGGLNNIVNAPGFPNGNAIFIPFFNPAGAQIDFILYTLGVVTSTGGSMPVGGIPTFTDKLVTFPGVTGIVPLAPPGPATGPFDFTVSVDTAGVPPWSLFGSLGAYIDPDRLTFRESLDMRTVLPRGSQTASGINVQGQLKVDTVAGPATNNLTVNGPATVNGGADFTFLSRLASGAIGTFSGAGEGSVKVLAWEGFNNTPITPTPGQNITFSAIPSASKDEEGTPTADGTICAGVGFCEGLAFAGGSYHNRVTEITASAGEASKVQPGDILYISIAGGGAQAATTKAGTYLVRHSVQQGTASNKYRDLKIGSTIGSGSGLVPFAFPTVESFNGTTELRISSLLPFPNPGQITSPTGHGFPATGRVYVILDPTKLSSTTPATYQEALVSAAYTGITVGTRTFTGLNTFQDALGNALTATQFDDQISVGNAVSGMVYLQVAPNGVGGLPDNNVVGYDDPLSSVYGFRFLKLSNTQTTNNLQFDSQAIPGSRIVKSAGGAGDLTVGDVAITVSTSFVSSTVTPVYTNVPGRLDIGRITAAQWDTLHTPAGLPGNPLANCLIPGEVLSMEDLGGSPGFYAQAGIFLEPSIPIPVFDLNAAGAHIVDASHSLAAIEIGMRLSTLFGNPVGPESVTFEVRRIRRFHDVLDNVGANLTPLRYAYEIRRGAVQAYRNYITHPLLYPNQFAWVEAAGAGTQLGSFKDVDVNVNSGDLFRLLDANGVLIEEIMIQAVIDGTHLLLARPGITEISAAAVVGKSFEIYLRQAPVPHEQSNAELLALVTDEVVYEATANYVAQTGGYVDVINVGDPQKDQYDKVTNKLRDDAITGIFPATYTEKGVKAGDIVLVDPAGAVQGPGGTPTVPERGICPFGDTSVQPRVAPFVAGAASTLDDNRGFYRVDTVNAGNLEVTGSTDFTSSFGDLPTDQIFPTGAAAATYGYAVYPTINASDLNKAPLTSSHIDREGQMDLRPTAKAGTEGSPVDSFKNNGYSIRPFSYKIIRPSGLFSTEAIDLILMMRERLFSWLEEIGALISGNKEGSYFVFQRDEHASDLGNPLIPDEGLGVLSNSLIQGVRGLESVTPFANDSDCLSVLDRRFWVLDFRLDGTTPPYTGFTNPSGGGVVRPVLPDHIGLVLDRRDRFRQLRYTWLNYRANLVDGTLASIKRFDKERPEREEEQRELLLRKLSLDNS